MIDNLKLYERKERDDYEWLSHRPECSLCGERIQSNTAVYLRDEWICNDCIRESKRVVADDYD